MTSVGWRRRLTLAVVIVLGVGGAILLGADPAHALRVGLFVLVAVGVELAVRLVGPAAPPRRRSAFAAIAQSSPPEEPSPPEHLEQRRRDVWLAAESVGGWHFRLRPVLREIADGLLEDRHGIGLDDHPEPARAILGPDAWERLRPDRPPPDDRWAPGISSSELASLVTRIEEL